MSGLAFRVLVLIIAVVIPARLRADEVQELKSQVKELQQSLEEQQRGASQRRLEEEQRQTDLRLKIDALQKRLEALSPAASPTAGVPSSREFSEDRPAFLERWLRKLGLAVPEARPMAEPSNLRRQTPSDKYSDPTSFFLLHAYTTFTYADFGRGLDSIPDVNEQVLVAGISPRSGHAESGFQNDTALFVGSELTATVKAQFELHLVRNAEDPVLTESKLVWAPFVPGGGQPSVRFVGGRYWWPFGIHNDEWFSAVNLFNLLSPAATEVVPAHYTEVGVMAEGEWQLLDRFGINYLVSVGNGVSGFELADNIDNTFDTNSNRTITTRVSIFPWVERLNVGASFAAGALRRGTDTSFAVTDARRYGADLTAYGVDGTYTLMDLALRGYWYFSTEDLSAAPVNRLSRNGGTLDALYILLKGAPLFREVGLKFRASTARDDSLSHGRFRLSQYGFGLNARPHPHFVLKGEYFVQGERGIPSVRNNGFGLSGSVEF